MSFYSWYLRLYSLITYLITVAQQIIRSCVKYFLRRTTKLCELQRIIYGTLNGYERTSQVERSLTLSTSPSIRLALKHMWDCIENQKYNYKTRNKMLKELVNVIAAEKGISYKLHPTFFPGLEQCMISICGLKLLKQQVYKFQHTPFKPDDIRDEDKLRYIWDSLMDEKLVNITSKQWGELGFQNVHPCTDLRGVGMLGVDCLLYLVQDHLETAKHLVSLSQHPKFGYPFGIVSIHITFLACEVLESGLATTHYYNKFEKFKRWHMEINETDSNEETEEIDVDRLMIIFYKLYVALFYKFNSRWFDEQPENIMQFPSVMSKFKQWLREELQNANCTIESRLQSA